MEDDLDEILFNGLDRNVSSYFNTSQSNSSLQPPVKLQYINITLEMPIAYAVPLYGYVMPFLLVITIIANTLIVVVLSKRQMRSPTNVVLMAMALCDMFTLLVPAPWLIYMYTFGNHYKPLWPISLCYAWNAMNEVSLKKWHIGFLQKHQSGTFFLFLIGLSDKPHLKVFLTELKELTIRYYSSLSFICKQISVLNL